MAGFFGIPREVYERTRQWDPVGYKIGLEILVKTKCRRVKEVPIHFEDRRRGESKLSLTEQLNYLRHLGRLGRFKYRRTCEVTKFALVGATGAVIDLTCFALSMAFGAPIAVARAIGIGVAVCCNFAGNEHWTFRLKSERGEHVDGLLERFRKYALSCALGAAASYLIAVLGIQWSSTLANYPLSMATVGITVGAVINFFLAKNWVFVKQA